MKKCDELEQMTQELKDNLKKNIDNEYLEYKEKMLDMPSEYLWNDSYLITIHKNLYDFMHYKLCNASRNELVFLQNEDVFSSLIEDFMNGDYELHHTGFEELFKDYVAKEKKKQMDGGME